MGHVFPYLLRYTFTRIRIYTHFATPADLSFSRLLKLLVENLMNDETNNMMKFI